jgi:signal transduction histidine kinase
MYFNRISIRIAAWYTIASIIASLLLFSLTGYFLATSLQNKDRELLAVKFHDYSALFEREGVDGIRVRTTSQSIPDARKFFVRLESRDGKTLFLYAPEHTPSDWPSIQEIDLFLQKQTQGRPWLSISGKGGYGDSVEILSRTLSSGEILQIGKDTEDREEVLKSYAKSFILGWLPVLALTILAGFFFSSRLLVPIRWLITTVKSIRSGNESARVPRQSTRNELDQLAALLNEMLDQNEKLIRGMRETLDHVAHDLRTPVMRLQLAAESALLSGTNPEKDLTICKEALSDCKENSDTILEILNAIMTISESEVGTIPLKIERVSYEKLVNDVIDLYNFVAEEKNIQLKSNVAKPIAPVQGDRTRLMQALANLVDNAIKYSPKGSSIEISAHWDRSSGLISQNSLLKIVE